MRKAKRFLSGIIKSGFVRSVVTRVIAIFITVSIIIAVVAFLSFTSEIRRTVLDDRQKQLSSVEKTISDRMYEIGRIAYNIEHDPEIYVSTSASGADMKNDLSRYLGGNTFVEHLAFCRTAEPDKIYTSKGERSLSEFFMSSLGMNAETADSIISGIHAQAKSDIRLFGQGDNAYFAYLYPIPLTETPLAHVMMLIPVKKVKPLFELMLKNGEGKVAVFDSDGTLIYGTGNTDDVIDLSRFIDGDIAEENCKSSSGTQYFIQKVVSDSNGWIYVSAMRHSDTLSGLANKQLIFIIFVLVLLVAAIVVMLISIIIQYKPISNLAEQVAQTNGSDKNEGDRKRIDERALLSTTIATLKDDSEQKQKYEAAFYEAEAASNAKSAFLSSMSHDIRTPMNAIIGMTAIARKHIDDSEYVDECLKKVQISSDYLLDIINNVLDMSRIESGRIPITAEPLLIPTLIDSVISLVASGADAKSQTINVDTGGIRQAAVLGDNIHLIQVFVNILSNAVKFTPEGGSMSIKVIQTDADEAGFGNYTFVFSDTGVGIAPEFIDHVFETFSRGSGAVTSKTEGTGLGMAIAKKLVELMGGTICCESKLGQGTIFTVFMKMKLADENEIEELTASADREHKLRDSRADVTVRLVGKRILLCEDNIMNREIARNMISETGAEVVEAQNGREAVELFKTHEAGYFDLIFMDIQMPVMNGYEATEAIRTADKADAVTIPIFAMTANTFDEDVRKVKEAGMNGHIGKPYSPSLLYKTLSQVFHV